MIFDDSTLVTRTRGKHDDTHLPIFPVGWFLDDILFDPRFHVCRNVLPHERHPRLRVRLSGQDNDTKCWRRRGVYFDRRKNPTIMPSTGLRIAHFEPFSFSLSFFLSLSPSFSPPLVLLAPSYSRYTTTTPSTPLRLKLFFHSFSHCLLFFFISI